MLFLLKIKEIEKGSNRSGLAEEDVRCKGEVTIGKVIIRRE